MSNIVQVGEANGLPVFGYASDPLVPSGFKVCDVIEGGLEISCERKGCGWQRHTPGAIHLTELAALSVEHVREHQR